MRNSVATAALPILMLALGLLPVAAGDIPAEMTSTLESSTPESSATPSPVAAGELAINLATPFTLELHQTARLDDALVIRFDAVVEDSRCPADAVCVWEGDAIASFEAIAPPQPAAVLALHTHDGFATEVRHGDYVIRLLRLDPYPRTDVEALEPYRATLVVITAAIDQASPPGT